MNISIIGGTGGMGKLFGNCFKKQSFKVSVIGRKTPNPSRQIREADVILISVPSHALNFAVKMLCDLDLSGKLIVSLGSCMSADAKKLRVLKGEIAFIHGLFGPTVTSFADQNFVVSGDNKNAKLKKLVLAIKKSKGNIFHLTVSEHDKKMAYIQALSQFSSLVLAGTLSQSNMKLKELEALSSITFRMNEDTIKRILTQKAALWAHIQFENPYFARVLAKYAQHVDKLRKTIKKKDYEAFEKEFKKSVKFWSK